MEWSGPHKIKRWRNGAASSFIHCRGGVRCEWVGQPAGKTAASLAWEQGPGKHQPRGEQGSVAAQFPSEGGAFWAASIDNENNRE